MSLKSRIWAAASVSPYLTLLGSAPFRMFDQQLAQGSAFPAVVMEDVSNPREYVASGQMPTNYTRIQFRVYGTGSDSENANTVIDALAAFLSELDLLGLPNSPARPNFIVGDRDFGIAETQPPTYMRILDVRMYSNELIS